MTRNRKDIPHRTTQDLRGISDYYKLNTKAVDDLVTANKENSPEVSEEELKKVSLPLRNPAAGMAESGAD